MNEEDKQAAEAADLRLDAERGWGLWRSMTVRWCAEGAELAAEGADVDDERLWSRYHKEGWGAAMRAADLAVDEAQYTPRPGIDF